MRTMLSSFKRLDNGYIGYVACFYNAKKLWAIPTGKVRRSPIKALHDAQDMRERVTSYDFTI